MTNETRSMTNEEAIGATYYRDLLEELALSRGVSGAEEMARRAAERDPSYTVRELLQEPPAGFGDALDTVLHMNEEEKSRVAYAFARTFLGRPLKPADSQ